MIEERYKQILQEASAEGLKRVKELKVIPMGVVQHANPLDDKSPIVYAEIVDDGVCGFAWVNIKPGTSKFVKYLKKEKIANKDSYYGGASIWIGNNHGDFNQSMQKKMAYASGYASVINKYKDELKLVWVHPMERMD